MQRREFIKLLSASLPVFAAGCALSRIDPMSVFIRSDIIESPEQEQEIVSRAKLVWTDDKRVRVIYLRGTPYERGYQHGKLLREEINTNIGYLYQQALNKFRLEELFSEAYERMSPFIPAAYLEEMHGLAHGSKMPLHVIHAIHALPEIGEWGGKRHIKQVVKRMMDGELGTNCSNFCLQKGATADGHTYTVRVLDWGLHRVSKLHKYPLIQVHVPDNGQAYANITWVGFIGAISGMNEEGITLGEMGYGDPPGETMRGEPMPFMLRDVLAQAKNLKDVRQIIQSSPGTNSYVFMMSDGKTSQAELYVRDRSRFLVFSPGQAISDGKIQLPGIENILYGGHYQDKMIETLGADRGKFTPQLLMDSVIPALAMPSNFQNVIYDAAERKFWVSNAKSPTERAAEQPYTYFDLKKGLAEFRAG